MTETTPALALADRMAAIAAHLRGNPHLSPVNLIGDAYPWTNYDLPPMASLQIYEATAVPILVWAKTLAEPQIVLRPYNTKETPEKSVVAVRGWVADGQLVFVWGVDEGDLYRWRTADYDTLISVEQLASYVAAGTVEHAAEHAPAVTS
ncbi:hypothetical protein [Amycolatopsis lurida]|uniref:hypothetical protein n=1 Tax=Amycolatopsis lurida TaxID=31959 RepID=UPI0036513590